MSTAQIDDTPAPRYEFRCFGQQFDHAHYRMARLSMPVPERYWERRSDEIYLLSRRSEHSNVKIRSAKLDIKKLVDTRDGLEQWQPVLKKDFPLERRLLADHLSPALEIDLARSVEDVLSVDQLLARMTAEPMLQAVRIHKRRSGYLVNDTLCEFAEVLINGARVVTISTESSNRQDVLRTLAELGLAGVENINYMQAIRRVIGWSEQPLAN